MKKIRVLVVFLVLIVKLASGQETWYRLDNPSALSVTDMVARSDGTVYFSVNGSEHVYEYNILNQTRNYSELPRMLKYPYDYNNDLLLNFDYDGSLIVLNGLELYIYNGNKYVKPVLMDTNSSPFVYDLNNIRFDHSGKLYFFDNKAIFAREEKWATKGETKIYENEGRIINFYPYSDSVNYSMHRNGQTDIYKYNSAKQTSRKLVSIPVPICEHSLINESGEMLLCAGQELYYYRNEGKEFIVPIIDSAVFAIGPVLGVFKSLSNKAIICYKSPAFYVTYDSCKTWIKIYKFSKEIPRGVLNKFVFWDTSHALLLLESNCDSKELFEISPDHESWNKVVPAKSNFNFSMLSNYNNEFIGNHDCYFMKSENEGRDWMYMMSPDSVYFPYNNSIQNVSMQNSGKIIFTFTELQNKLYRSTDFGRIWKVNNTFSYISQIFRISKTELILISLTGPGSTSKANFYYSDDNGDSWQLRAKNSEHIYKFKSIKFDSDGNLIAFLSSSPITTVLKSIDKGFTWIVDNRFKQFAINDISFERDGRCIINGVQSTDKEGGFFATYDFVNFINLAAPIKEFGNPKGLVLGDGVIVAYAYRYPSQKDKGVYLTSNDGHTWTNISYNLPDFQNVEKNQFVNELIIDNQGQLHISLPYDGFWRLNKQLINTANPNNIENFETYPNPVSESLMISVSEKFQQAELHYVIFDMLGTVVLDKNLKGSAILNISEFSAGTYILQVSADRKVIYSDKILKY